MRNSLIDLLTEERSLNRQIDDVQEELFNIRNDIAPFMNSPHSDTDAQHRHAKTLDQNVRVNVAKGGISQWLILIVPLASTRSSMTDGESTSA